MGLAFALAVLEHGHAIAQPVPAGRNVLEFSIPSTDGKATLAGQIDFPANVQDKMPVAVLIPGTGLFERKVLLGVSGTDRDFVFEDLKNGLVTAGIAVLRFDLRGVHCTVRDLQYSIAEDQDARDARFLKTCIDNAVRRTVTPQTLVDDVATVLSFGQRQTGVDARSTVIVAHSEGALHAAKVLQTARDLARGVVIVGPMLASPAATVRWQMTDRVDGALRALKGTPGRLTAEDVRAGYGRSILSALGPIEQFLPPSGVWTDAELDKLQADRNRAYESGRVSVLATSDDEPFPSPAPVVQASFAWWKMFFADMLPVAERLADFPGSVHCIFGGRDSQTDYEFQRRSLDALRPEQRARFAIKLFEGFGHTLGEHFLLGPMAPDAKAYVVEIVRRVARGP